MALILTVTSLVTATISGIIGMGGGILLLATLFCFLPVAEAIPLHAAVQLASNGTRLFAFRAHVDRKAVRRFLSGAVPGTLVAGVVLWVLDPFATSPGGEPVPSECWLKILIGAYILAVPYKPRFRQAVRAGNGERRRDFEIVGVAAGLAAPTIGAVGPLIAPVFAQNGYVKENLIATKAACQMLLHVLKIVVYAILGTIVIQRFSALLAPMAVAAILGTLLGKRVLRHVSAEMFTLLYRVALTVAGAKVLFHDGVYLLVSN